MTELKKNIKCRVAGGMRVKQKGKGLKKGFLNNKNGLASPKTKSKKKTTVKEEPIVKETSISESKVDELINRHYEKMAGEKTLSKTDLIDLKTYKFDNFNSEEDDDVDNPNSKYKIKMRRQYMIQANNIIYNNNRIKVENNLFNSNKEKLNEINMYNNFKSTFKQKVIETIKIINKYDSNNNPLSEEEIINNAISMISLV